MEKEILDIFKLIQEGQKEIVTRIDNLEEGQKRIEKKLDGVVEQTVDLTEFKTSVLNRLENLKDVEKVTKENCYEIARIKAGKQIS